MTLTPDVTAVVASRNRCSELLSSLDRHEAPVILVDNGSTDDTVAAVRDQFPAVRVVELGSNRGAAARTIGARLAATPYVAFADDDSWWAPGCLGAAVELLRAHRGIGLLNAKILVGSHEQVDPVCELMAASPLPRPADVVGVPVLGFVACASIVRRSALLSVGGFDDVVRFPGEEERVALDLAAAGWQLVYADDLVVHHHPSPRRHSPAERAAAITRSKVLTALMRLSWAAVGKELVAAWRSGPSERAGVRAALPDLPAALRQRRRVPAAVESQLRVLAGAATGKR